MCDYTKLIKGQSLLIEKADSQSKGKDMFFHFNKLIAVLLTV